MSDQAFMQSAIHGEAEVDGALGYVVGHDGLVTVYRGARPVSTSPGTAGAIRWISGVTVDRLEHAHAAGERWTPPPGRAGGAPDTA